MASRNGAAARLAWHIENATSKEADVWVYDVIGADGFWEEGVNSIDFCKEIRGVTAERINMHVNSPGGYVNDAIAMYNALLAHPAEVIAYIEGSADSAASFLVQAADKRVIAKTASMTIHEGHAFAMGPASTFRALADELDATSENIAGIYADRAGGTTQEWRDRMLANGGGIGSTYRGQGAVDIGLCDEVGLASKNSVPQRIAAYFRPAAQATTDDTPSTIASEVAAAISAAKLTASAPSLLQLLEERQREPLSAALTRR